MSTPFLSIYRRSRHTNNGCTRNFCPICRNPNITRPHPNQSNHVDCRHQRFRIYCHHVFTEKENHQRRRNIQRQRLSTIIIRSSTKNMDTDRRQSHSNIKTHISTTRIIFRHYETICTAEHFKISRRNKKWKRSI